MPGRLHNSAEAAHGYEDKGGYGANDERSAASANPLHKSDDKDAAAEQAGSLDQGARERVHDGDLLEEDGAVRGSERLAGQLVGACCDEAAPGTALDIGETPVVSTPRFPVASERAAQCGVYLVDALEQLAPLPLCGCVGNGVQDKPGFPLSRVVLLRAVDVEEARDGSVVLSFA